MNVKTSARLLALSVAAMCIGAVTGFAGDGRNCRDVGGNVLTNFLDQTHAQGPVTGDLRGAVAVEVLGVNGNVYHIAGLVAAQETIKIVGGTGHFDGATGTLSFFGAINGGEVTLRYDGTVCLRPPSSG